MSDDRPYLLHRLACLRLKAPDGICNCDGPLLLDELLAAAQECSVEGEAAAREKHKVSTAVRKNPVLEEMIQNKRMQAFDRLRKSAALVGGSAQAAGGFRGFTPTTSGLHVRIKTGEPGERK